MVSPTQTYKPLFFWNVLWSMFIYSTFKCWNLNIQMKLLRELIPREHTRSEMWRSSSEVAWLHVLALILSLRRVSVSTVFYSVFTVAYFLEREGWVPAVNVLAVAWLPALWSTEVTWCWSSHVDRGVCMSGHEVASCRVFDKAKRSGLAVVILQSEWRWWELLGRNPTKLCYLTSYC